MPGERNGQEGDRRGTYRKETKNRRGNKTRGERMI